jgi:hypothetical protein
MIERQEELGISHKLLRRHRMVGIIGALTSGRSHRAPSSAMISG